MGAAALEDAGRVGGVLAPDPAQPRETVGGADALVGDDQVVGAGGQQPQALGAIGSHVAGMAEVVRNAGVQGAQRGVFPDEEDV